MEHEFDNGRGRNDSTGSDYFRRAVVVFRPNGALRQFAAGVPVSDIGSNFMLLKQSA